jgi:hypothetical protein
LPLGFVTFEAPKVTKVPFSRKASFRAWPSPCKSAKTSGCKMLPYFACRQAGSLQSYASATIAMPFPALMPPSFWLISPEAVLLTLKIV